MLEGVPSPRTSAGGGGHSTAGEGPQIPLSARVGFQGVTPPTQSVRPFLVEKSEATGKQCFLQFNWPRSVTCFRNILFNL